MTAKNTTITLSDNFSLTRRTSGNMSSSSLAIHHGGRTYRAKATHFSRRDGKAAWGDVTLIQFAELITGLEKWGITPNEVKTLTTEFEHLMGTSVLVLGTSTNPAIGFTAHKCNNAPCGAGVAWDRVR